MLARVPESAVSAMLHTCSPCSVQLVSGNEHNEVLWTSSVPITLLLFSRTVSALLSIDFLPDRFKCLIE